MDEEHAQIEAAAEDDDKSPHGIDRFFLGLAPFSPYIALLAAWTALCGSLFFSQVIGWIPCTLCLIIASMMALSLAAPMTVEEEVHGTIEVENALSGARERLGMGDLAVFAIIALAVIAYVTGAHVARA